MARKKKGKDIALEELRGMVPILLICNALLLIVCGIFCWYNAEFDWRLFSGVLLGNIVSVGNFYLLGVSASTVISARNEKRAQFLANGSYGIRYIGMFAVYAIALVAGVISPLPALAPLFFPRIHYLVKYIFFKEQEVIE